MTYTSESIRHYSDLMILNEGVKDDVKNMFISMNLMPKDKDWLDNEYDWAKETFITIIDVGDKETERERRVRPNKERIMWYMRNVKLHLLEKTIDGSEGNQKMYDKALSKAAAKAGDSVGDVAAGVSYAMRSAFKTEMQHFMSMEIHSIKNMEFSWEAPQKLIAHMKAAEDEWKKDQDAIVEIQDDDEIIIDFGDGYAWWNLNRGSCNFEAKAMGHCGNAGTRGDDTILSLRRKTMGKDNQESWSPVATFILDGDGVLGEMKGRFNDKPDEKYHPYIIRLLEDDIIQGIKGGGYLPQNNFNMRDLDSEDYDDLVEKKPELRGVAELFSKDGNTAYFRSRLETQLRAKDIEPNYMDIGEDADGNTDIIIEEWSDLNSFLRGIDDDHLYKMLEFYEDGPELDNVTPDHEYYMDLLAGLPTKYQQIISEEIGIDITTRDRNAIRQAIEAMETGPREYYRFIEYMNKAIMGSETATAALKEKVKARIQEYLDAGFGFVSMHVGLDIDHEDFNKPVKASIRLSDLVYMADAEEDDEDEYAYELDKIREFGYTALDWENHQEMLGQYNADLIDKDGKDKEIDAILNMNDIKYDLAAAVSGFIKVFDMNERRITEEAYITDLKRRAGIL